ncbi:MAG: hypothetical protein KF884_02830 [Fimbriimonadaceae bacterium]|nr:hypothetical protein [Fimbriimonadaceae bacterium]QYK59031.1 MAG: hypothetical protein KF884_02830 [Fimbriimonadaceae bacterium]
MRPAALLALLAFSALVHAQANKVAGNWKGSLQISAPAEMKSQIPPAAQLPKLDMTLKGDGTYSATMTQPTQQGSTKTKVEGTWKLQGQDLTITPKTRDGKPATGEAAKPRIYKLSPDGKTLTLDLTADMRRAAQNSKEKGADKVTMKVVLKKA